MKRFISLLTAFVLLVSVTGSALSDEINPGVDENLDPVVDIVPEDFAEPVQDDTPSGAPVEEDGPIDNTLDIAPEATSRDSVKAAIEDNGHAYFAVNNASGMIIYADKQGEEPLCEIASESIILCADTLEDGMLRIWFIANGSAVSGWVSASYATTLLDDDSADGMADIFASGTGTVSEKVVILFVADLKESEPVDNSADIDPAVDPEDEEPAANKKDDQKDDDPVLVDPVVVDGSADSQNPPVDIQLMDGDGDNNDIKVDPVEDDKKPVENADDKQDEKPVEDDKKDEEKPAGDPVINETPVENIIMSDDDQPEPVVEGDNVVPDEPINIEPDLPEEEPEYVDPFDIKDRDYVLVHGGTTMYHYILGSSEPSVNGELLEDAVLQVCGECHFIGDEVYVNLLGLFTLDEEYYVSVNIKDISLTNVHRLTERTQVRLSSAGVPSAGEKGRATLKKAMLRSGMLRGAVTNTPSSTTGQTYKKSPDIASNAFWDPSGYEYTGTTNPNDKTLAINAAVARPWSYSGSAHPSIYESSSQVYQFESTWTVLIPIYQGVDNDCPIPGYERDWYDWHVNNGAVSFINVYCIEPNKDKAIPKSGWHGMYDRYKNNISYATKKMVVDALANGEGGWYQYAGENTGYSEEINRFLKYVFRHGNVMFVNVPEEATAYVDTNDVERGNAGKFCYSQSGAIREYFIGQYSPEGAAGWNNIYNLNTASNPNQTQLDYAKLLFELGLQFSRLTPSITTTVTQPITKVGDHYEFKVSIEVNTDNGWAIEKSVLNPLGITCTNASSNDYAYYGDSGEFTFSMTSAPSGPISLEFGAYESIADIKLNVWIEQTGSGAGNRQRMVNPSAVPASASAHSPQDRNNRR